MIFETLQKLNIPCVYSHFKDKDAPKKPPYIVYIGNGQDTFAADNTFYHTQNRYQVEYYFTKKDESIEAAIESQLLADGFLYEKSEDVFIEEENVFVIYYLI
jgi:hypothetical protein